MLLSAIASGPLFSHLAPLNGLAREAHQQMETFQSVTSSACVCARHNSALSRAAKITASLRVFISFMKNFTWVCVLGGLITDVTAL
jgi:hypothetical protein